MGHIGHDRCRVPTPGNPTPRKNGNSGSACAWKLLSGAAVRFAVRAGAFAAAFYRGLAYGKSVQTAFDLGLNELQLKGLMDDEAAPVLLIREGVDASAVTLL